MSRQFGKIVHYCCPAFLLFGPIMLATGWGVIGAAVLGLGLMGLYFRVGK